jgi:4-hydroxybenzoate polyprenyltransferase
LLTAGVVVAWVCSPLSAALALGTAISAIIYDSLGKHHALFGPLNMGTCRGLNWLLGLSAASRQSIDGWPAAVVALCYIAGITSLSRGEVRGGTKTAAIISAGWLIATGFVLALFLSLESRSVLSALPFFAFLLYLIVEPFWLAFRTLQPLRIQVAVKAGILSLIMLDAGLAAAFAGPLYGLAMLLLYIPATSLARLFAVT